MTFDPKDLQQLGDLFRSILREEIATRTGDDVYVSVVTAAKIAETSPAWIREQVHLGKLPRYGAGREIRVRRSDLDRLLAEPADRDDSPEAAARLALVGKAG